MLIALMLCGCTPGKLPFLIVQTCLNDEAGVEAFVAKMQAIAFAEHMDFADNSEDVAQLQKNSGDSGQEKTHGSRVLHVSIRRADGVGTTATNLGLPGFEVALGFSEGSDAEFAHAFADRVMAQLSDHWKFVIVPSGTGAKPRGGCP
jgi:hypothetical protein